MFRHSILAAGLGAVLTATVSAQFPASPAARVSHQIQPGPKSTQVRVDVDGGEGPVFLLLGKTGYNAPIGGDGWQSLGLYGLDAGGHGTVQATLKNSMAKGAPPVHLKALHLHNGKIVETPVATTTLSPLPLMGPGPKGDALDLAWGLGGIPQAAGTIVSNTQPWAAIMTLSADNAKAGHPDELLLFDSAAPTGGDSDLATPGYGPGNDEALGMLLIVAENVNDADHDDLVDSPDDEAEGGTMVLDFGACVSLDDFKVVDIEGDEPGEVRYYDGAVLVETHPLVGLGDNSVQTIPGSCGITRIEVELSGSGAIGGLRLYPCEAAVNFDETSTGVPLGLATGQIITDDANIFPGLGLVFSADNDHVGHPDESIIFDTDHPTGGDTDLGTPGSGPGNDKAEHKVLIIAEDAVDANLDDLVDDPDDEADGGAIVMEWVGTTGVFRGATILDIDTSEASFIEVVLAAPGDPSVIVPLVKKGDNSSQTIDSTIGPASRVLFHFAGSGAVAEVRLCPHTELQ